MFNHVFNGYHDGYGADENTAGLVLLLHIICFSFSPYFMWVMRLNGGALNGLIDCNIATGFSFSLKVQ